MTKINNLAVADTGADRITGYPEPTNEEYRLKVVESYDVSELFEGNDFDRLVRLAAAYFQAPISLVTLVGEESEKFPACHGIELTRAPREGSFCSHALVNDGPFVVLDAKTDPRFENHPAVIGAPFIRSYVGAPLLAPEGVALGTLCIIGTKSRASFTDDDRKYLEDLAAIAVQTYISKRAEAERNMEAEELARKTFEREQEGQRAKSQFLSIIGHELRTPINAIQGFASMIEAEVRGPLGDEKYKDDARNIVSSSQRLTGIVEILETYAQARTGTLTVKEVRIDVRDVIDQSIERVAGEASGKDIRISNLMNDDGSPQLFVDPHYFEQAISNLLSNAIRYAAEGGNVDVGMYVNADRSLVIWVGDDGPGLSEDAQKQALTPFEKNEDALASSHGGLGLGLPLTEKLMELHGGGLSLGRGNRGGLCVSLTFPGYRHIGGADL